VGFDDSIAHARGWESEALMALDLRRSEGEGKSQVEACKLGALHSNISPCSRPQIGK
jgi:hypothetical protein